MSTSEVIHVSQASEGPVCVKTLTQSRPDNYLDLDIHSDSRLGMSLLFAVLQSGVQEMQHPKMEHLSESLFY